MNNPPGMPEIPQPSNAAPAAAAPPVLPAPTPPPPLADNASLISLVDSLLKRPAQLTAQLCLAKNSRHWSLLLLAAVVTFVFYGFVIGSFTGGEQYFFSPLKVSIGELFSFLICFPSFYIFTCLAGIDVSLRGLTGVIFAVFALTGILLLGFAPVAWVFSQSTTSEVFIGTLHLLFWWIAIAFGVRLLRHMERLQGLRSSIHLKVWLFIFILVSLQMTTTLRPIIGSSNHLLAGEKKFFLAYWLENLSGDAPASPAR